MERQEALEKIAWYSLKKLSRDEAEKLIIEFFDEPLKPSLREKLNITVIAQFETRQVPDDLNPGNPIYRPVLIDKLKRPFRGATNEYLAEFLISKAGLKIDKVTGDLPGWLPCPVCGYQTFETLGAWDNCPICGWNSDPVQETIHDDPTGGNGISLNDARKNYQSIGAITKAKFSEIDPEEKKKYPR